MYSSTALPFGLLQLDPRLCPVGVLLVLNAWNIQNNAKSPGCAKYEIKDYIVNWPGEVLGLRTNMGISCEVSSLCF